MKLFYIILLLLMSINISSAAYVIGDSGLDWTGNSTIGNNATERQSTGYIVAKQELDDAWDEWWFDAGTGTSILNENRTSAHDLTVNQTLWNSDKSYHFDGVTANILNLGFQYAPFSEVTVGLKINVTDVDEASDGYILYERAMNLYFLDNPGNLRRFSFANASLVTKSASSSDEPIHNKLDTWFATYDGSLMSLYNQSGLLGSQTTSNISRDGALTFKLGGQFGKNLKFKIHALKMWKNESLPTSDYSRIFNYRTTGNMNISFSNNTGTGQRGSTYTVNITGTGTIKGYSSNDNSTWTLDSASISANTPVTISTKNQTQYIKIQIIPSASDSPNIISATLTSESDTGAPSITSSSPSTPTTSFVNESKTFNAGSNQLGNWTWYVDSILKKSSETNTANGTYTNSAAPNGTTINVTAIITNANGSAQTSWSWTPLQNYVTSNVTYLDGINDTIVCIFNVSYVSNGTTQWGFNFSWTDSGQQYNWTYTNGTVIQSLTATSTNETLEFIKTPPELTGIYYIQKASTTIETFVVIAGAFAAVVVAGAAVVSRRVRRGISGFWNRRIRRR